MSVLNRLRFLRSSGSRKIARVPTIIIYAPALMASGYDLGTGAIEALEMPGYHWVIGVAWPLHHPDLLPARFDNLIAAFVERSTDA